MKQARLFLFFLAICGGVLCGWVGSPQMAYAFHFPWDQGHDTFNSNNPPPPEKDQPTKEDEQTCGGDPVNLKTGEFFFSNTYHDIAVSNLGPNLSLSFTYQSRDRYSGPFGNGWHTPLTEIAVLTDDGADLYIVCRKGTGQRKRFTRNPDGSFERPAGLFASVSVQPDDSVQLTDKFGTTKTYDTGGRLVSITDRNGNTLSVTYDNDGVISQATGAGGRVMTFTRGANGRIASVTDPAGRVYKFAYDTNGNLTSVTDPEDGVTQYAYDAENNLTTITDPRGNAQVTNVYDNQDRVTRQTYADSSVLQISYQSGNTTRVTNERSLNSTYSFNENGNPTNTTDPLGRSTVQEWNDDFLLIRMVDARSVERQMSYDANGNLTSLKEAIGTPVERTLSFQYDAQFSQPTQIIDGDGKVTNITLDNRGNPVTIVNPLGDQAAMVYDNRGLVTSLTDENSNTTTFTYNAAGELIQLTNAEGDVTSFSYDGVGNLLAVTEGAGSPVERTKTFTYDGRNRVISATDGEGGITTFAYNLNSNLVRIVDPTGVTVTRTYDARNRLSQIDDPATGAITFNYDATGNLVTATDALGNTTTYTYDAANQLISTMDARGFTTGFGYDAVGNLLTVTNAKNATTTFAYDPLNRRSNRVNPLGETITYTYDGRDNLVQTVDAKGQMIVNSYDDLGRLISVRTPDNVLRHAYDAVGNLTAADDNDSALSFTYDQANRLVSAVTGGAIQPTVTLTYSYDTIGRRADLTDSENGSHSYSYDDADRLTQLLTPANETIGMSYDVAGRPIGIAYPNGVAMTRAYDLAGRVQRIIHAAGGSDLLRFDYTYNALGNITQIDDLAGTQSLAYDATQQLISGGTNLSPENYAYDAVGNRTNSHLSSSYNHNAVDRLLQDDNFTYSYDANGNLIMKTDQVTGTQTTNYSYDAQDQLVAVNLHDGTNVSYSYDALGRRIAKTIDNDTIVYVYDGPDILLEFDGSNVLQARFSYGAGVDQPVVIARGSQYYYHADHLGSIRRITASGDSVTNSYEYDSFGQIERPTQVVPNPYAFTGRERDPETGLYYYRARYYDPVAGRFITQDPLGFAAGDLNLYRYVFNNPSNLTDPDGQAVPLIVIIIAVGGTVSGGFEGYVEFRRGGDIGDVSSAFGRGFASGSLGTGVGLAAGAVTGGNPYAVGSAAGLVTSGTNQFLQGCGIDPATLVFDTALGAVGGRITQGLVRNTPLRTKGRLPNLLAPRRLNQYGPNSLRLLGQEAIGGIVGGSLGNTIRRPEEAVQPPNQCFAQSEERCK